MRKKERSNDKECGEELVGNVVLTGVLVEVFITTENTINQNINGFILVAISTRYLCFIMSGLLSTS